MCVCVFVCVCVWVGVWVCVWVRVCVCVDADSSHRRRAMQTDQGTRNTIGPVAGKGTIGTRRPCEAARTKARIGTAIRMRLVSHHLG